jgi:hypothetical protein
MNTRDRAKHLYSWLDHINNRANAARAEVFQKISHEAPNGYRVLMKGDTPEHKRYSALTDVHVICVHRLRQLQKRRHSHTELDDIDNALSIVESSARKLSLID